jgi:hypothetical protein
MLALKIQPLTTWHVELEHKAILRQHSVKNEQKEGVAEVDFVLVELIVVSGWFLVLGRNEHPQAGRQQLQLDVD